MYADESPLTSTAGDIAVALDGAWQIAADPGNRGEPESWFDAATFPQGQAKPIQVPGVPSEVFPMKAKLGDAPNDAYWYFRTFALPDQPPPRTRYYLRFGAVRQSSDVWLNGKHLGSHGGGEDPFEYDVTALLQTARPNALAVRVKMHRLGGIWQSVKLVAQPDVRIIDSFARPDATAKKIDLEVTLENNTGRPAAVEVAAELGQFKPAAGLGRQATVVTAAPGVSTARLVLPVAQPHPWDLDDPFLYTVKVTSTWQDGGGAVAGRDTDAFRTGFRDIRMVGESFYLNGRRF